MSRSRKIHKNTKIWKNKLWQNMSLLNFEMDYSIIVTKFRWLWSKSNLEALTAKIWSPSTLLAFGSPAPLTVSPVWKTVIVTNNSKQGLHSSKLTETETDEKQTNMADVRISLNSNFTNKNIQQKFEGGSPLIGFEKYMARLH